MLTSSIEIRLAFAGQHMRGSLIDVVAELKDDCGGGREVRFESEARCASFNAELARCMAWAVRYAIGQR